MNDKNTNNTFTLACGGEEINFGLSKAREMTGDVTKQPLEAMPVDKFVSIHEQAAQDHADNGSADTSTFKERWLRHMVKRNLSGKKKEWFRWPE